jgi:hypothetical protein
MLRADRLNQYRNGGIDMAERRRGGDKRATRREGPGGAGAGPNVRLHAGAKRASGQQSGSKRPAVRTGTAKRAPKKGEPD